MFFKDYSKQFEEVKNQQQRMETLFHTLSSHFKGILDTIHEREHKILDIEEKLKDNMKRVNDMTLELKSVVSQARSALSERKALDEFLVLAEKRLIELIDASKEYCDKKIKK